MVRDSIRTTGSNSCWELYGRKLPFKIQLSRQRIWNWDRKVAAVNARACIGKVLKISCILFDASEGGYIDEPTVVREYDQAKDIGLNTIN